MPRPLSASSWRRARNSRTSASVTSFGDELKDFGFEAVAAQGYLGGTGIGKALESGADIMVCGRVNDAASTVGASMWWHG